MPTQRSTTRRLADQYPNRAFIYLTTSAANTLTFEQVQFGVGLFQGVALVLNRIEWCPDQGSLSELVAAADRFFVALTNRADLASLEPENQNILAYKSLRAMQVGAVVSLNHIELPLVSDFSSMPGGGLIMPANPLYIGLETAGFAAVANVRVVMYFTFKQLADAEYIELIQTIMPSNL